MSLIYTTMKDKELTSLKAISQMTHPYPATPRPASQTPCAGLRGPQQLKPRAATLVIPYMPPAIPPHSTVTYTRIRRTAEGDNVPIEAGQPMWAHGNKCTMIDKWAGGCGLRDGGKYEVGKGIRYMQSVLTGDEWAEGWGVGKGKGIRYRQSILTRDEWAEGWGEIYDMGSMIPYPVQSILTGNAHPVHLVYTSGSIPIHLIIHPAHSETISIR
ncbi:hypothetical protein EDB19DRAFT_1831354 [Suillus lakei]|nr:hypothetical protein EDB19DRAFT_1831354 [Suillus lakei]